MSIDSTGRPLKLGIRFQQLVGRVVIPHAAVHEGMWLKSFDPEAFDGRGDCKWTTDPKEAKPFWSIQHALDCYQTVSKVKPVRADGQPNKPLTAFTVTVEPLPSVVPPST